MRVLGVIQPGRLGDIIICLPLAKWYADRGYQVFWPIHEVYCKNFTGYIDYVHFHPINAIDCHEARRACINNCNTIIDVSITLPHSHPRNDIFFHSNRERYSFDEVKYLIGNVPFNEKWNLVFNRNMIAEQKLFDKLSGTVPFTLVHAQGSNESFRYSPLTNENVIYVENVTESIFDWYSLIFAANKIIAIDSSFANLVEQVGYAGEKFLVRRSQDVRPRYKNWIVL